MATLQAMDAAAVTIKKLGEQVLQADGTLPLSLLLQYLVPVQSLRVVAQKLGLTPKGGFRIERAPAKVLAPLLAEQRDKQQLDDVLSLLVPKPEEPPSSEESESRALMDGLAEARALLDLRDAEVHRLRTELERAREGQVRAREREVALDRQVAVASEQLVVAKRSAVEAQEDAMKTAAEPAVTRDDKTLQHRLHELEAEREGFLATDEALRRQLARDHSRTRELEDEVAELESLIPASRRRKKKPMLPEPEQERRFLVPHFLPSFYKSLESKERRSVERALQAVLLFCTEGHAYPGLEVKQIGGQDTWSMRASLGLRVYFRPRAGTKLDGGSGGDIEVLELGNREDQNTTLRRLKEK